MFDKQVIRNNDNGLDKAYDIFIILILLLLTIYTQFIFGYYSVIDNSTKSIDTLRNELLTNTSKFIRLPYLTIISSISLWLLYLLIDIKKIKPIFKIWSWEFAFMSFGSTIFSTLWYLISPSSLYGEINIKIIYIISGLISAAVVFSVFFNKSFINILSKWSRLQRIIIEIIPMLIFIILIYLIILH